jgi:uncharacterized protein YkvS
MIRTVVLTMVLCSLMIGAGRFHQPLFSIVYAEDDWKSEFDDICQKTEIVASLTKAEIKSLIERCDALKPRIEKIDEAASKVYLKRLQRCHDLFVFMQGAGSR